MALTAFIIWLVCAVIVGALYLTAPLGYEDSEGWHPGIDPEGR